MIRSEKGYTMNKEIHIFFDIDYTILDIEPAHRQAIASLGKKYGEVFADEFDTIFHVILEGKRVKDDVWASISGGKKAYESTLNQIQNLTRHQRPFIWSRELHAFLASQRVKKPLTPKDSIMVAELYWSGIAHYGRPYSDAKELVDVLTQRSIEYHFFTSSDFRLKWSAGAWQYDPDYSARRKMERIVELRRFGMQPRSIAIGDPIDKPETAFYKKMLHTASEEVKRVIKPQQSIIVGDSYVVDVQVPTERLHFSRGYWLRRGENSTQISKNIFSISSLVEIIQREKTL